MDQLSISVEGLGSWSKLRGTRRFSEHTQRDSVQSTGLFSSCVLEYGRRVLINGTIAYRVNGTNVVVEWAYVA